MSASLSLIAAVVLSAEPMSLEQVVAQALERNVDVVSANYETDVALWGRRSALSSAGPRVRVEGSLQAWDQPLEAKISIPGLPDGPALRVREQVTVSGQVTIVQPLFALWPILEGYRIKDLGVDIARLKQAQARRDVTFQVTEAFYRLLQAQRIVEVSSKSVAQVTAQVGLASAFERQGLRGRNDVLRAEIALAGAKQRLLQAKGGAALALSRLRDLLRLGPDEPLTIAAVASAESAPMRTFDLVNAQRSALTHRTEIAEVAARVEQARSARRIAWTKMLPSLNGVAAYQYTQGQALAQKDQFFMGLSAQWDVFEWGATYFGTREAAARQNQAELGLERLKGAIALDAQAAFVTWDTSREALAVAEQAVLHAEENYRIESKRYENATSTTFDVLDAETLLTQARAQRENAFFDLLVAQAGMQRATGTTDVSTEEHSR